MLVVCVSFNELIWQQVQANYGKVLSLIHDHKEDFQLLIVSRVDIYLSEDGVVCLLSMTIWYCQNYFFESQTYIDQC